MKSPKHSAITFSNNLIGHLNLLWAIARVDKSITCIKLGSAGCYMDIDTSYLPLSKKDLTFNHRGKTHKILDSFFPMQATDFYHQSKISDFLVDDLCAKVWNLKIISVQQSTIFGATIEENHGPERVGLSARFNYDSTFGTVMNRFICQSVIGHPMTIYGDGKVKTGLISLSDTIENFIRLTALDVKPGSHQVVHNYSHRLSIEDIAQNIAKIEPGAKVQYIANPRKEGAGKLEREVEIHQTVRPQHLGKNKSLEAELERMLEFTKRHSHNIDQSIIMPSVKWSVAEKTTGWKFSDFNITNRLTELTKIQIATARKAVSQLSLF
jgi:UDP-sulfoquinovose synthase